MYTVFFIIIEVLTKVESKELLIKLNNRFYLFSLDILDSY